jgi:lipoprotein-releasing system permease protein
MTFSAWVGWRFLHALGRGRGWSLLAVLSVTGLVLGVAALLAVLSVMQGFQSTLQGRLLQATPHVMITTAAPLSPEQLSELRGDARVQTLVPFVTTPALFSLGGRAEPGAFQGFSQPAWEAFPLGAGDGIAAPPGPGEARLGRGLAARLGVFPGDTLTALIPEVVGTRLQVRPVPLRVVGYFSFGAEVDQTLLVAGEDSVAAAGLDLATSYRLALADPQSAPAFVGHWQNALGAGVQLTPWTDRYGALFAAVALERRMMGLVVGLIIAVALFNLVASLTRLVDEKRGAIAMLMTQGASRQHVAQIFLVQGAMLGGAGSALGAALGYGLAENAGAFLVLAEQLFSFSFLGGTYFQALPSDPQARDFLLVSLSAAVATVFAAAYPAWRASQVLPARALH